MPRNPSLNQRIDWHRAHAKACGCREVPPKLAEEMAKRGIALPKRA